MMSSYKLSSQLYMTYVSDLNWLLSIQGFLLYQKTTRNSYLESKDGPARPASNMDRFERCFSIFKLTKGKEQESTQPEEQNDLKTKDVLRPHMQADTDQQLCELSKNYQMESASHKIWRAVRVDLVVSPISQFAFAVLGWTGSKVIAHAWPLSSFKNLLPPSFSLLFYVILFNVPSVCAVVWEGAATLGWAREEHVSEQSRPIW